MRSIAGMAATRATALRTADIFPRFGAAGANLQEFAARAGSSPIISELAAQRGRKDPNPLEGAVRVDRRFQRPWINNADPLLAVARDVVHRRCPQAQPVR